MRKQFLMVAALVLAGTVSAQMPHRVAVLVNENSQDSKKAANVFAALHGVPGGNLIYLDLPDSMVSGRSECSPEEFRTLIYEPAQKTIKARKLDEQIVAWVYSVDFPIRVVTDPSDRKQMSIMGLTFLHGEVPDLDLMEKGQLPSPLFAGPVKEGGPKNPPRSFDVLAAAMKDKMPLPSMMLGYTGENGNDMNTVLRCIQDGVKARQNNGGARVLLIKTDDDKRSGPREWQYADVKAELALRKSTAVIYTNTPPAQTNLMGVMTGVADLTPKDFGSFAPGAMGEHLTSWSAEFQKRQSKCTEWLRDGATVTAGMVTEPYNVWTKFPHARFFVHYASGCSAMESFYQSIFSPFQILLLGDPLSQITGLPVQIKEIGLSKEITSDLDAAFVVEAKFPLKVQPLYSALLDGRQIKHGEGNSLVELPFKEMGDGYHEVRLIAQALVPVAPGGFTTVSVMINKKGRSMKITGMADGEPRHVNVQVVPEGADTPKEVALLWNGRELDRKPYAADVTLAFDERTIGEGPHRLQAVGIYEDGMEVRSEPQGFTIAFREKSDG